LLTIHHPIVEQSFAIIDREIGPHDFSPDEYAIVRRVIHSTADFEFARLIKFSPGAIERAIFAICNCTPIVTDVSMVKQGIVNLATKTFGNPLISAIDRVSESLPGKTLTETGLIQCWQQFPEAIFVIGNAPTALLALCDRLSSTSVRPAIVIGATVGFVSVLESKAALANIDVPQIRIEGRKGGSPVAAAIVNALIVLAWERSKELA
jgi:precorrin-8X/cobalt-precorrin-8 methylmutase